jgi:hypothetical protein
MPTNQTSSDPSGGFGIVDIQEFNSRWPALAYSTAMHTAKETGVDPSDPRNITRVMQSRTYQSKVNDMAKNRDDRTLKRITGSIPTPPDRNATTEQQTDQIYSGLEQTATNQIRARGIMTGRQVEAQTKLDQLADFDRESYKGKRLKELNPSGDLDSRMLNLRLQAFTAKAILRNEMRDLPPALRNRAVAERMGVFSDALASIKEIRDARVRSAESQIDEEIDAHNDELRSARAKVSGLRTLMDHIEQSGEDQEALASIRLDWLKEKKKLLKATGKGVVDEAETLTNAILNDYRNTQDDTPSAEQIKEAQRQAKEIVRKREDIRKATAGKGSALAGVRSSNIMQLPVRPIPGEYLDDRSSIFNLQEPAIETVSSWRSPGSDYGQ